MFKNIKIDLLLIVISCFLLSTKLYAQHSRTYLQDSLRVRALLVTAENCIKSASANCSKQLNDALQISVALGSSFLKSLCYRSLASAERRNRTALLYKYDSLSVTFARECKDDSLLIVSLLNQSHDFCSANKPEKAKLLIEEAFLLLKQKGNTYLMLVAKYEQGFYFLRSRNFTEAGNNYKQALSYAQNLKDPFWIAILHRSIYYSNVLGFKKPDSTISVFNALEYLRKVDLFEAANCLNIIGYAFRINGNTEKADTYFNEAALMYKKVKYSLHEANMYINIAEHCFTNKEITRGIHLTGKSEKIYTSLGYNSGIVDSYLIYGRLYAAAGKIVKSDFYFNKADSILKRKPGESISGRSITYKMTRDLDKGEYNNVDSFGTALTRLLPKEVTDSIINRAASTGLLSKAEAVDLKKNMRTGKLDTALWNKKPALENLNPYTGDLVKFNSQYNELFNKQTTEMETKYRTKLKDDSLKNVLNENKISQLKINRQNWLILLITIITLAVAVILYQINRARKRVVQEKKTIELLKVEADHRVKNTLNIINTIVRSVKSQSSDKLSFGLLEERVEPLMILYDMLNKKNTQDIYLQDYFENICNNLSSSYNNSQNIQVYVDAPVMLDGKKAGTAGLMVNELVTNAFKHAFPHKENHRGEIWVACKKDAAGGYILHVSDSGIGFKETVVNINSKGLMQVKALAEQLSASITEKKGEGVVFEFYFM